MTGDERLVIVDGDAETDAVREYEATRRDLVRRGLLFGGLTVAAAGIPTLIEAGRAFAQADGDVQILEGAVRLEQTLVFTYATVSSSRRLSVALAGAAHTLGNQEQQHSDKLVASLEALGGTPPAKPVRVGQVKGLAEAVAGGQTAILRFAVALEEMAVAAYHQAAQKLDDAKLLQTSAAIMGSEGQHLVVLREALRENPVPHAFEIGGAGRP